MERAWTNRLRDNAPLVGVLAIIALTFAALAIFGPEKPRAIVADKPKVEPVSGIPLVSLPATADEDATFASILDPQDARLRNAAVPVHDGALVPTTPFAFHGKSGDRARARDCLALAAMAEAGGGDADQRAVMQVILNRTRHPAFASTVCGVVFEGSQRPTGCQFTFTCDGSLSRSYSSTMWESARRRAEEALGGYSHKAVGTATHYHADYVFPYWAPSLDKVAVIGSHIFYRWKGNWGTARALTSHYVGREPDPMALRERAEAIERPADLLPRLADAGTAIRTITPTDVGRAPISTIERQADASTGRSPTPGVHFVLVSGSDSPATLIDRARALCPGDRFCQVYGWDDATQIPGKLPLSDVARRSLRFSFLPARAGNAEVAYVDCRLIPASDGATCLPRARP